MSLRLVNASSWLKRLDSYATTDQVPTDLEACQRYYGSFAWVKQTEEGLIGARDHFGCEPFFYCFEDNRFVFGSSIKAILEFVGEKPILKDIRNRECFLENLKDIPPYTNQTHYKDIYRVEPGCSVEIKQGKLSQRPYWVLDPSSEDLILKDESAYHDRFKVLLEESINFHLSDFKARRSHSIAYGNYQASRVGLELSGGLDSSVIAYALHKKLRPSPQEMHIFTNNQKQGLSQAPAKANIQTESQNLKLVVEYCKFKDIHFINGALVNVHSILSVLKAQFLGPVPHLVIPIMLPLLQTVQEKQCQILFSGFGGDDCVSSYLGRALSKSKKIRRFSKFLKLKNVAQCILSVIKNAPANHWRMKEYNRLQGTQVFNLRMRIECSAMMAKQLGFEYRYPLLYPPLVEFCFRLPKKYKIRRGIPRYLMQQYVRTMKKPSKDTKLEGCIAGCVYGEFKKQLNISSDKDERRQMLHAINNELLKTKEVHLPRVSAVGFRVFKMRILDPNNEQDQEIIKLGRMAFGYKKSTDR